MMHPDDSIAAREAFRMADVLPPSFYGRAFVEHQELSAEDAAEFPGRVEAGTLVRLWIGGMMATTDALGEFAEQYEAIGAARGQVLVLGLGLGAVVRAMLTRPDVLHIDVIEANTDVIELCGQQFTHEPRVDVYAGNAWNGELLRGKRWDMVFADIWVDSDDHEDEHERMRALWASRCDGPVLCWRVVNPLPDLWAEMKKVAEAAVIRGWRQ